MFRVKNDTIPEAFKDTFRLVEHQYSTRFSQNNFAEPMSNLRLTRFAISSRDPHLWNNILVERLKTFSYEPLFKSSLKPRLFSLKNETSYF